VQLLTLFIVEVVTAIDDLEFSRVLGRRRKKRRSQLRAAAAAGTPQYQDKHFLALGAVHVVQVLCGLLE
jgi:hypothetical protein